MSELFPRLTTADDYEALRFAEGSITYAGLAREALSHANGIRELGVREGERVGVWAEASLETVVALLGNACAGVVSVPLNPRIGQSELAHIANDGALVRTLGGADGSSTRPKLPSLEESALPLVSAESRPSTSTFRCPIDDRPLLLLYTSGTTGAPKGVPLNASNIASNIDALAAIWHWSDADRLVHVLPLFHVHGLILGLWGTLRVGASATVLRRFDIDGVARAFNEGATMLFGVPTIYHRLADAAESDERIATALGRARIFVSGSAGLPLREHERFRRSTGQPIYERYGLTETLINTGVHYGSPRPGTVGLPLPGVTLRLVDDQRRDLPPGDPTAIGEIAVRGPSVFSRYLNRPDATSAVLDSDGFFYTGDLATRDDEGMLRIVGRRATDLIKTGGFKVGAGEIEACLLQDPAIAHAAVVGIPDDDLGERIVAFVIVREGATAPTEEQLVERVARELAPHKKPREVRFVQEFPRNAMGKVLKAKLKELLAP